MLYTKINNNKEFAEFGGIPDLNVWVEATQEQAEAY